MKKYWYFTADVLFLSKKTKEVRTKTFSSLSHSNDSFFPLTDAIGIVRAELFDIDMQPLYDRENEDHSIRIINQMEISKNDYESFSGGQGYLPIGLVGTLI